LARARQGEIYLASVGGRIGFARDPEARNQLVVVVQGDALNEVLETLQVTPLVRASEALRPLSLNVVIPGAELGGWPDHLAQAHLTSATALSRLMPGPIARISEPTLARLLQVIARVFR
jgi:mRNA-degrading endonuclease toxin of MazEF toxin-antitoxin module